MVVIEELQVPGYGSNQTLEIGLLGCFPAERNVDAYYKEGKDALRIASSVEVSEACTYQPGQGIRGKAIWFEDNGHDSRAVAPWVANV